MVKHVISFKFKNKEDAPIAAQKLQALMGAVPSLRSLETGLDFMGSERSYDLVLIATFDDRAGLEAYDKHPAHQEVRKYIHSVREASVAVDFEY